MRILVVDDDADVLQGLLAIVKARGEHEIRAAVSGEKALANAAALGGVDLLITDVVMEPINGFSLRDQLEEQFPGMSTIFVTGYDLTEYAAQIAGHQVLQKPIEAEALAEAIEAEAAELPAPRYAAVPKTAVSAGMRGGRAGVSTVAATDNHQPSVGEGVNWETPRPSGIHRPDATARSSWQDTLVGEALGNYQILRVLGKSRWGTVYAALQVSMNRPVALKVLDAEHRNDAAATARFIADARAKAHVQHPSIVSVYEAGEANDHIFYAHEYVDGQTVREIRIEGDRIEEPTGLKMLRVIAEGLSYLETRNIPHTPLDESNIFLTKDGQPRLANVATQYADEPQTSQAEIQTLARAILSILPAIQTISVGFRTLLSQMVQSGAHAVTSWPAVLQGVKVLEPKVVPVEAAKISAQDRVAIEAVEAARKQQKRSFWLTIGTMAGTLAALLFVIWFYLYRTNERNLDVQIRIPAGEYIIGNGQKVQLEDFWIDKYEVTIGQYADFLRYLEAHPTADSEFNHPKQPRHLEHQPADWKIYYGRAAAGKPVHSVPTSLNSPMLRATWWDAYAYAKWKECELPTEEQWEAAARGKEGFIYPWGNDPDPKRVNSNTDFNAQDPSAKATVDGFNHWGDVDAMKGDRSPFGIIGMAGNVSEWVAAGTADKRPIVKGGNFMSADVRLDRRVTDRDPNKGEEFIGFRTVSKTPPK